MNSVPVGIVVNGALVTGSTPASISGGVVVAPLDPYALALATRISQPSERDTVVVARGDRTLTLIVGSRVAFAGPAQMHVPLAPYLRAGNLMIPLAAVARALGATVAYDARTRTLAIDCPEAPLATLAPATVAPVLQPSPAPPPDLPTFAPTPTPAPQPTISGIPKPRRTPIPIGPDR